MPIELVRVPYKSSGALEKAIEDHAVSALHLCDTSEREVQGVIGVSRRLHVLTMAVSEALVAQGVSLAAVISDGKPKVLLNATASNAEGAKFSVEFQRLARLVP